jgi:type II secretory pathway pseudopilin PulG
MTGRGGASSGVTLVELLIAVALLGFIMLGIAPLFIASVKSNYSANEYTSIHNLARDRLEQLMNLPFDDPQLAVGLHANDQPSLLPAPLPPTPATVVNPFTRVYQVRQFRIPADDIGTVPANSPFVPILVTAAGDVYDYKRIDVEVRTDEAHLGIGTRRARVSGILQNPSPATNRSQVDPCPAGTPFAGCAPIP